MATPTFILPDELGMAGYQYIASPTLYAGQLVEAGLTASGEMQAGLFVRLYNHADTLETVFGPEIELKPNVYTETSWQIPNTQGQPIAEIGLAFEGKGGTVYLDYLTWAGAPDVILTPAFWSGFAQGPTAGVAAGVGECGRYLGKLVAAAVPARPE